MKNIHVYVYQPRDLGSNDQRTIIFLKSEIYFKYVKNIWILAEKYVSIMLKILIWAVMTSQGGGKGETGPDCASGAFLTSYTSYSLSNLHYTCQKVQNVFVHLALLAPSWPHTHLIPCQTLYLLQWQN